MLAAFLWVVNNRYTHRTAISNNRLLDIAEGNVE